MNYSSSYNDRSFAPEWVTKDIGLDFEYMRNVADRMPDVSQDLPDNKFGSNAETILEICAREFEIITQLILDEDSTM
jgi:hypothetical protein